MLCMIAFARIIPKGKGFHIKFFMKTVLKRCSTQPHFIYNEAVTVMANFHLVVYGYVHRGGPRMVLRFMKEGILKW